VVMIDTRTKRESSIGFVLASFLVLPLDIDRQELAYSYSGIKAMASNAIPLSTFSPTILISMMAFGDSFGFGSATSESKPQDVVVTVPGRMISVQLHKPSIVSDVVVRT
jgi:hypothetical protein